MSACSNLSKPTALSSLGRIVAKTAVDAVIAASPKEVERYKAGNDKLIGFFVGQVMKQTGGRANPAKVNELVKRKLG